MKPFKLALLFTGHMIDAPGREIPRFPPELECEAAKSISRRIGYARQAAGGSVVGIASGARGGDILFLEACRKEGLSLRMVLPFAPERFLDTSVRGIASGDWEARFFALWNSLGAGEREILEAPEGENAYDFCNRHMLAMASELSERFRLIALWDGKDTNPRPGGAASLIALVRQSGGHAGHIDSKALIRKPRS